MRTPIGVSPWSCREFLERTSEGEGLAKSLEKHSKYLQREFPQSGLGPCSPAIIRFKEELLLAEAQYQNEGMLNEAASGVRGAEAQRRALDLMRAMETRDGYGGLLD